MAWTVETLNGTVDAELAELPADMRARLVRISELIESVGLPNVKEPHVRRVRGQFRETRLKGKAGIARALYVTAKRQRVVIRPSTNALEHFAQATRARLRIVFEPSSAK